MDYIKQIDIISASEDFGVYLRDLEDFCEPAPGGFVEPTDYNPEWAVEDAEGLESAKPADGQIHWTGKDSGWNYKGLIEFLKLFKGRADLVLTWGEPSIYESVPEETYHTGLRVDNGRVTRHVVNLVLGEERGLWT